MESNTTRVAFLQQPCHFLVVDVCSLPEMALNNICCALSDVLAIASSIRGSCRIPAFGLIALSSFPNCLLPLKSVRRNYPVITSALDELQTWSRRESAMASDAQPNTNSVRQCLEVILSQFNHFNDWQLGNSSVKDWKHLQLTFMTLQRMNGVQLAKQIEETINTVELAKVKKIQVVNIEKNSFSDGTVLLDFDPNKLSPDKRSNGSENHSSNTLSGMIDIINLPNNLFELERFFKIWLYDHSTDKAHLIIKLPEDIKTGKSISLLCDIQEQHLNPGAFVFGSHFFINVDPLVCNGLMTTQTKQTTGSYLPVIELEAIKLIHLSGVCESTVFGIPLRLQPTNCWQIEWSELEINRQYFQAVLQMLKERECILVVSMKQLHKVTPMKSNTMSIYFGIFASDTALLIKSLTTKELLLPMMDGQTEGDYLSDDVKETVSTSMNRLPFLKLFNPLHFSSGLCTSLKLYLADNKAARENQMKQTKYSSPSVMGNLWELSKKSVTQAQNFGVCDRASHNTCISNKS